MIYTIAFIAITTLVSIVAFSNAELTNKLILWPRRMQNNPAEYHRLLSSGFIHADWNHLIFNMFTLYFFGPAVEDIFGAMGSGILFPVLYLTAIVVSDIPSFIKHKDSSYYRSLGASGGVAAIVSFFIYYYPWSKISIIFIPIGIPSIIYGALYLLYSAYMARKGGDNINHDAHFWGTVYGLLFAFFTDASHGANFLNDLMHPRF